MFEGIGRGVNHDQRGGMGFIFPLVNFSPLLVIIMIKLYFPIILIMLHILKRTTFQFIYINQYKSINHLIDQYRVDYSLYY